MDTLLFLCLLSVAFPGLTRAVGILPDDPLNAAVGDTVTFTTTLNPSQTQITYINWRKDSNDIVTHFPERNITYSGYEGRITLFPNSAALELRTVTVKDSGVYHVNILNNGAQYLNSTKMDVYVRVSDVVVVLNATQLVEFNSSVSLTCTSSGSALSFLWLNVTSEVTDSDRVQITDGGSTLIITTVTRYDQGPFTCLVSNPVSNGTSSQLKLSISYGPENIIIEGPTDVKEKETFKLTCYVDSKPSATFNWSQNGTEILIDSDVLSITKAELHHSGDYLCRARNNLTQRTLSAEHRLSVTASPDVPPQSLSPGAIAGITIACLLVVGLVVGVGVYIFKKRGSSKRSTSENTRRDGVNNRAEGELNYAEVKFPQKRGEATAQVELQNTSTDYAQVQASRAPRMASSPPAYDAHLQRTKGPAPQSPADVTLYSQVSKPRPR